MWEELSPILSNGTSYVKKHLKREFSDARASQILWDAADTGETG